MTFCIFLFLEKLLIVERTMRTIDNSFPLRSLCKKILLSTKFYAVFGGHFESAVLLQFHRYDLLELIALVILVIVGLVILVFVVKLVLMFIPAAIVAFVVWFFTHSLWWAGIAFLVIAVLSIVRKLWHLQNCAEINSKNLSRLRLYWYDVLLL